MLNTLEDNKNHFKIIDQGDYIVFMFNTNHFPNKFSKIKKSTFKKWLEIGECVSIKEVRDKMNVQD